MMSLLTTLERRGKNVSRHIIAFLSQFLAHSSQRRGICRELEPLLREARVKMGNLYSGQLGTVMI